MCYGKYITSDLQLKSMWSAVLYNNILAIAPMTVIGVLNGEVDRLEPAHGSGVDTIWSSTALFWLLVSCVLGLGISFAGFNCRNAVSAASYTLIGVLNKMATITVNVMMWDKHASGAGIASLLVCLVAGAFYKQAPKKQALLKAKLSRGLTEDIYDRDVETPGPATRASRKKAGAAM